MKIRESYPPNYTQIKTFLPVDEGKPIFCYGDTIYNPHKIEITNDLLVHEQVHSKQQGKTPDLWWHDYLRDDTFRLREELEAYGVQYAFIKDLDGMTSKMREWVLDKIAQALSGDLYGNLLTYHEAKTKIRKYEK